jgi:hypothetical protein
MQFFTELLVYKCKVKLFVCLSKYYAMKAYWGSGYIDVYMVV